MKLSVFNLGDLGVNLTMSPLHVSDGEWIRLQNAALELRGADHGIAKRPGMAVFASGFGGAVFSIVNLGVVPVPPLSEGAGELITPAGLNIMRCKLYLTAATTEIANDSETVLDWTAEAWDVGNLHDLVTNPDRITVPTDGDGLYLIIAQAQWATEGNNVLKRTLRLLKNAGEVAQASVAANDDGDVLAHQVAALVPAVAGDYFTVSVEQDTGDTSDLVGNDEHTTWVTVLRVVATATWNLPRVHVYRTADLDLLVDTPTLVEFDAEAVDTHAMHDLAVNTSRLTVPVDQDGAYLLTAQYALEAPVPVASHVAAEILKNGTQTLAQSKLTFINAGEQPDTAQTFGGVFELVAGDYVELRMTARGAARTVLAGVVPDTALASTSFSAARIG